MSYDSITVPISDLIGRTIVKIDKTNDEIIFHASDDVLFKMYHSQDCCEHVYIEDVNGDLEDLLHTPILRAEEVSSYDAGAKGEYDDSYTWTFYKLATIKGYVDIRWYGTSNGYYSERVDFVRL